MNVTLVVLSVTMELTSWPDGKSISSTCTCNVVKDFEWAKIKCFPYEIISFPELVLIYNRVNTAFSLSVSCQNEWKQTLKKNNLKYSQFAVYILWKTNCQFVIYVTKIC